jgi:hypothetical protein
LIDDLLRDAEMYEAAIIATSSLASARSRAIFLSGNSLSATTNSSQSADSSASSSTTPIFAINSARDRPRHADR